MMQCSDPLRWIDDFSADQARQHLKDRGLSLQRIVPVLRKRLRRYEAAVLRESTRIDIAPGEVAMPLTPPRKGEGSRQGIDFLDNSNPG